MPSLDQLAILFSLEPPIGICKVRKIIGNKKGNDRLIVNTGELLGWLSLFIRLRLGLWLIERENIKSAINLVYCRFYIFNAR